MPLRHLCSELFSFAHVVVLCADHVLGSDAAFIVGDRLWVEPVAEMGTHEVTGRPGLLVLFVQKHVLQVVMESRVLRVVDQLLFADLDGKSGKVSLVFEVVFHVAQVRI